MSLQLSSGYAVKERPKVVQSVSSDSVTQGRLFSTSGYGEWDMEYRVWDMGNRV